MCGSVHQPPGRRVRGAENQGGSSMRLLRNVLSALLVAVLGLGVAAAVPSAAAAQSSKPQARHRGGAPFLQPGQLQRLQAQGHRDAGGPGPLDRAARDRPHDGPSRSWRALRQGEGQAAEEGLQEVLAGRRSRRSRPTRRASSGSGSSLRARASGSGESTSRPPTASALPSATLEPTTSAESDDRPGVAAADQRGQPRRRRSPVPASRAVAIWSRARSSYVGRSTWRKIPIGDWLR